MDELNVFVGRQPIFDRAGNIFGYELLYRDGPDNAFPQGINPEKATLELLVNTFLTIGIDRLVGRSKSFINFSQLSLQDDIIDQLDSRFVIIELLEDIEFTDEVIATLGKLRKKGFKIALDDFSLRRIDEEAIIPELFEKVNFVKVDFLNTEAHERRQIESLAKKYRNITLLAEKIESAVEHEEAEQNGYLLFQGYHYSRPQVIKGKEIPPNYLLHFQLLKEFNEKEPNIDKLSKLFMRDVSLSYKLLRYINSLTFEIPHQVTSIQQAIMLMGLREAKRWLRILILRDLGIGEGRGREKALIERSLVRAKLIELIAQHKRKPNADEFFLAGLFSLIDLIMQSEIEYIVPELSLSDKITATLLGEETEITPYLDLVTMLESLDGRIDEEHLEVLGLKAQTVAQFVQKAHQWATMFD
ncbi:MAG TPA: HDOD domain-containing protein [Pseudogracilibacillus sp.]|nr:HDOD domain-containing protein [Pseudogracilibacillus sp.]